MIVESAIVGSTAYYIYKVVNKEKIIKKRTKQEIKNKWNLLMDGIGKNAENKIDQKYEILDIFIKHYGFDFILSIPYGKKFNDILGLIPLIESCYKANAMVNLSEDKSSVYVRVHLMDSDISAKDGLKFNWFKTFYNIDGCMTKNGETINIDSMSDIKSPSGEVVGFRVKSKIPVGLSYDKIKSSYDVITKTLGKCFLNFNYQDMLLETSIIYKPISNDSKFYGVKVRPWELYIAMGQDWCPIILDYSENANCLTGGCQGSGKTNALFTAFVNLCSICCGDTYKDGFDLFVSNIGEKNDLRIFKDVKQCKYYANNEIEVLSMLKYLKKEVGRRNKLFAEQKSFCFNIHQYNKLISDKSKQLKVIHLIADEIADLMSESKDDGKEEIQRLIEDLIRKSRSSGIYVTMATQRGSLKNMSSEVKGQLANKICFSQPNTASALTIMSGEDVAKRVMSLEKKRECLVDYIEGIKVAKTLFLNEKMMEELLKPVIVTEDNKLKLDINGNIIEKVEKIPEATKENKILENPKENEADLDKKEPRWIKKKDKKKV